MKTACSSKKKLYYVYYVNTDSILFRFGSYSQSKFRCNDLSNLVCLIQFYGSVIYIDATGRLFCYI